MEVKASVPEELNMHIVFRVKKNLFSINGGDVLSIQKLPKKLLHIPYAPDYVRGSYQNLGEIVTVVDLRRFFEWNTSEEEYDAFTNMIDQRKSDHIHWVETLKTCRRTGKAFTLAKDCHQCALGKWRDTYETDVPTINRLLNALDKPHAELHSLADHVLQDTEESSERILTRMDEELVPEVFKILDTMKEDFRDHEFREMVILLRGGLRVALTVDEVLGVETLRKQISGGLPLMRQGKNYIRGVRQRMGDDELVMELDIPLLSSNLDLSAVVDATHTN